MGIEFTIEIEMDMQVKIEIEIVMEIDIGMKIEIKVEIDIYRICIFTENRLLSYIRTIEAQSHTRWLRRRMVEDS